MDTLFVRIACPLERLFIANQPRRKFTPEYRREAANLAIESDRPIAHVAEEIGVSAGLLGKWVKNERQRRGASDGMSEADLRAEIVRLRRELAEAKMSVSSRFGRR